MPNLNIWLYDNLNPDDYKEVRALPTKDYVYCNMDWCTHTDKSLFFGSTQDHHVPVVLLERLSPMVLVSHIRLLEQQDYNRIIVLVPDYQDMVEALKEAGYEPEPMV